MSRIISTVAKVEGRLRQCLAVALGVGSFGWGLSIMLMPEAMYRTRAFEVTVHWAAPQTWGVVFMTLGAVLVAAGLSAIKAAVWPAALLAVTYSMVSISVMLAARSSDPVPTAIWAYLTLGAIAAILAQASVVNTRR